MNYGKYYTKTNFTRTRRRRSVEDILFILNTKFLLLEMFVVRDQYMMTAVNGRGYSTVHLRAGIENKNGKYVAFIN